MREPRWRIVLGAVMIVVIGTVARPLAQAAHESRLRKPVLQDTVRLTVYADNWFQLYINGELVAVDSIRFLPHNVVAVDVLPDYPMTLAVMACDNADPETGMEYANTNVGDGGFILKLGDGTVTSAAWRARVVSRGPVGGADSAPRAEHVPQPDGWNLPGFDDSDWEPATEYSQTEVDPKETFFEHDFTGARFIWGRDLKIDNTVLFRCTVRSPPDGVVRPDFSGINELPMNAPGAHDKQRQGSYRPNPEERAK